MWSTYLMIMIVFIFSLGLPLAGTSQAQAKDPMHGIKRDSCQTVRIAQFVALSTDKQDAKSAPAAEKSEGTHEDEKSQSKPENTPRKPSEKSTPLKDFVPSEEIEADKAVDLPADI